ncbi:hypothetical protein EV175_005939 [Coemansia sp. RSA 1933]|nr:hypothetical protein EV175_005939 [Coemansia sp. RSA 1933]
MVSDAVLLDFENAEVRSSDFESLKPEGWLTGEIINFYWTYLERREFCTEPSVLFLGTYTTYRISNAENATVTDNISAQLSDELNHRQMVLIPLNHRSHWSLLVYCRLTRTFYHYDSISKHNRNFAERAAGKFLRVLEPNLKDGFYFKSMQTPQQNNDYDCGIYVLAIAEELARRFINNKNKQTGLLSASNKQNNGWSASTAKPSAEPTSSRWTTHRERVPNPRHSHRDNTASNGTEDGGPRGRYSSVYDKLNGARDFSQGATGRSQQHTAAKQQPSIQSTRRNQSTPPVARTHAPQTLPPFPATMASSSPAGAVPSRALTSDLLMPRFSAQPFSGFQSPFAAMYRHVSSEFHMPEPSLLKGGGSDILDDGVLGAHGTLVGGGNGDGEGSAGSRSREERLRLEMRLMEKAGLPRDFWLVTVEDIEYPHCMRRRIRSLVLGLQEKQQKHQNKDRQKGIHW